MKKTIVSCVMIGLLAMGIAGSLLAADLPTISGNRRDRLISELKANWNDFINGTKDVPNLKTSGESTIDGKYAVVGGDATTGLMIQKAAITSTSATLQTNSFATVFGAAPVVTCTYTEDPGDVRPIFIVSVNPTNFVASVTADKNFSYIAVGTRP